MYTTAGSVTQRSTPTMFRSRRNSAQRESCNQTDIETRAMTALPPSKKLTHENNTAVSVYARAPQRNHSQ
jgi:hypothetical protein